MLRSIACLASRASPIHPATLPRLAILPRLTAAQGARNYSQGTRKGLLPEFSLKDKVIIVSGAGRGLGLVQAEALLEAGATGKFTPTDRGTGTYTGTQILNRCFESWIISACNRPPSQPGQLFRLRACA